MVKAEDTDKDKMAVKGGRGLRQQQKTSRKLESWKGSAKNVDFGRPPNFDLPVASGLGHAHTSRSLGCSLADGAGVGISPMTSTRACVKDEGLSSDEDEPLVVDAHSQRERIALLFRARLPPKFGSKRWALPNCAHQ